MNTKSSKSNRPNGPTIVPDSLPPDELAQKEREERAEREAAAASMRHEAESSAATASPISEADAKTFVGMLITVVATVIGAVVWFFQSIWYSFKSAVYTVADNDIFLTILTAAFIASIVLVGYTAVTMAGPVMVTGFTMAVGNSTVDTTLLITVAFALVSSAVLFVNSVYEKVTGRKIDTKALFAYRKTVRAVA